MALRTLLVVVAAAAVSVAMADRPPPPPPSYEAPSVSSYEPSYHVPDRNCSVEFEKASTELCVPTLQTQCSTEEVTLKAPVEKERCITIPMVSCSAEVRTESIEICVYVYEKKDIEADAKVAEVKYTKRCDTEYVKSCKPAKPAYGYKPEPYCKEVPQETCFNKPLAESKDAQVVVTIPQPVKKCETKKIKIPSVNCEETTEERCFNLVTLEDSTKEIEKCVTTLAEPKCNKVSLQLPAQTCVEQLRSYRQEYS